MRPRQLDIGLMDAQRVRAVLRDERGRAVGEIRRLQDGRTLGYRATLRSGGQRSARDFLARDFRTGARGALSAARAWAAEEWLALPPMSCALSVDELLYAGRLPRGASASVVHRRVAAPGGSRWAYCVEAKIEGGDRALGGRWLCAAFENKLDAENALGEIKELWLQVCD
jgi:hypothetical protein